MAKRRSSSGKRHAMTPARKAALRKAQLASAKKRSTFTGAERASKHYKPKRYLSPARKSDALIHGHVKMFDMSKDKKYSKAMRAKFKKASEWLHNKNN